MEQLVFLFFLNFDRLTVLHENMSLSTYIENKACLLLQLVHIEGCVLYLGVEWRGQISELCDVSEHRGMVLSLCVRPITALQAIPPV